MVRYRLALDLGTNSIGWCALALDGGEGDQQPAAILDMGSFIFSDGRNPKDGTSNAVARRQARGMRKNRDRFVQRRDKLIGLLVAGGLFPKPEAPRHALAALDPYELRARGLDGLLALHEFGRAIFHLNQRRGFKSNRKSDASDKEAGVIKMALKEQAAIMTAAGARSFGEYLALRNRAGQPVRSRLLTRMVPKGKDGTALKKEDYYEFYPSRELLQAEFNALWDQQAQHHAALQQRELREQIHDAIFYQRPLKPQVVGRCTFDRSESRASRALPMVQRCRIYQELNHLHILDTRTLEGRALTLEERDRIAKMLSCPKGAKKPQNTEIKFNAIRKALKLGDWAQFSLESEKRQGLAVDVTSAGMAYAGRFGARWYQLSDEEQETIVSALLETSDEEALIQQLMEAWDLDREHAEAVASAPLLPSYSSLGKTATQKILTALVADVVPYSTAVQQAGYRSHSQFAAGQRRERLPYYGEVLERHIVPDPASEGHPAKPLEKRLGKLANPTVHIALNQLRKVVNEVIKLHGAPAEIHLEVLRDLKNSVAKRAEIEAEQAKNQKENEKCANELREVFHETVNRENIQRLRLWAELGKDNALCLYTGESISAQKLFSPNVEIDHILPESRTLDDGMGNKVLCMRHANRDKGDRTPFEAWGHTPGWQGILDRISILPPRKQWRFAPDAMEKFLKENDFLQRQLTDSQYITRLAREYLAVLLEPSAGNTVVCLPGRLTSWFRHQLGMDIILDEINPDREHSEAPRGVKNRNDHRHHAVDALVIGLMDRAMLQRAARLHSLREKAGVQKFLESLAEPWPGFHAEAREVLRRVIVAHRRDHGIEAALHNDMPYGVSKADDPRGQAVKRVPADKIKVSSIVSIRGRGLRAELVAELAGITRAEAFKKLEEIDDKKKMAARTLEDMFGGDRSIIEGRIKQFFESRGIRRVRLIEQVTLVFPKKQGNFKGYKPGANAYIDLVRSHQGPWSWSVISSFAANDLPTQLSQVESPNDLKIQIFKDDMLELEFDGEPRIFRVQMISQKQLALAEHFEANTDARLNSNQYNYLLKSNAEVLRKSKVRFLVVTPAGRIRYLSDPIHDSTGD